MRSTTASPSKRYHGVPLSDDGDDNEMGLGSTSSPWNENDQDNTAGFQNGTSASLSRKLGISVSQYSRVTDSDLQENDMSMQDENNENDDTNTETNSLVLGDASSPSSLRMTDMTKRNGIFRHSSLSMKDDINDNDDDGYTKTISRTPSAGAASTTSKTPTSVQYDTVDAISENVSSPTGLLSRQGSRCGASSTVSSVDWDDDDTFDDDIANIRRYHLEYSIGNGIQTQNYQQRQQETDRSTDDYPITECGINLLYDCFRCRIRQSISNISYHWQSLRQAARQRRAARLLTMPSENIRYKIHVCIVSSCCDATDVGIALTASCLLIWILFGFLTHNTTITYWLVGISLFVLRVSARRCYQFFRSIISSNMSYRRQQRRQNQQQRGRLDSRQYLTSIDNDHFPQNDTFAMTREIDNDPVPTSV